MENSPSLSKYCGSYFRNFSQNDLLCFILSTDVDKVRGRTGAAGSDPVIELGRGIFLFWKGPLPIMGPESKMVSGELVIMD